MIALTSRLNERDETIIQLQEELDAFDIIHCETEEFLDFQTHRADSLEGLLVEHGVEIPQNLANPNVRICPLMSRIEGFRGRERSRGPIHAMSRA